MQIQDPNANHPLPSSHSKRLRYSVLASVVHDLLFLDRFSILGIILFLFLVRHYFAFSNVVWILLHRL